MIVRHRCSSRNTGAGNTKELCIHPRNKRNPPMEQNKGIVYIWRMCPFLASLVPAQTSDNQKFINEDNFHCNILCLSRQAKEPKYDGCSSHKPYQWISNLFLSPSPCHRIVRNSVNAHHFKKWVLYLFLKTDPIENSAWTFHVKILLPSFCSKPLYVILSLSLFSGSWCGPNHLHKCAGIRTVANSGTLGTLCLLIKQYPIKTQTDGGRCHGTCKQQNRQQNSTSCSHMCSPWMCSKNLEILWCTIVHVGIFKNC